MTAWEKLAKREEINKQIEELMARKDQEVRNGEYEKASEVRDQISQIEEAQVDSPIEMVTLSEFSGLLHTIEPLVGILLDQVPITRVIEIKNRMSGETRVIIDRVISKHLQLS